ncbi:MAG: hypothetical protein MJ094_02615 [Saccharofermentans sp.]|nr:hypothetical protein [Saccharofermentans sp.]
MEKNLRGHSITCMIFSIIELVVTILKYAFFFLFLNSTWFIGSMIGLSTHGAGLDNLKQAMIAINVESAISIPALIAAIILMSLNLSAKTEESKKHSKLYLLVTRIILIAAPILGIIGIVIATLILNYVI